MGAGHDFLAECTERLKDLPFVEAAALARGVGAQRGGWDAVVQITTPTATTKLVVEATRTNLTRTVVDGVLAAADRYEGKPWILFAPHVGRPLGAYLAERGVNFLDRVGNCRIELGKKYFALIEGRPPKRRIPEGRGMGAAGLQVLFALMARPELLNEPVRTIAQAADVAKATVADRLATLRAEGLIHEGRGARKAAEPRRFLDLWLNGYETLLRPKLLIGRYRVQETDPEALERRIEATLGNDVPWAFGGGAAANRLIRHYRGEDTVLHVGDGAAEVVTRLRAIPDPKGPLILLKTPGPAALQGARPRTVAPLLVYTELLHAGDKRAIDAAAEVRREYLGHLP